MKNSEAAAIINIVLDKLIPILEEERDAELKCAKKFKELAKSTLNPIRKIQYLKRANEYENHVFGADLIIGKVRRFNDYAEFDKEN